MSTPSTPTIGVISDATLAQTFRELGFRVITGASFRESATAISGELKSGLSFPVVIAETDDAGVGPWVSSTAGKTSVIVIPSDGPTLDTGSAKRLEAPATVNDLLPLLGYQGAPEPFGSTPIGREAVAEQPLFPVAPEPLPLPTPQAPAPPSIMSAPVELPPPADLADPRPAAVESHIEPSAPSALFPQAAPTVSTPPAPAFVDPTDLFPQPHPAAAASQTAPAEIDNTTAPVEPETPSATALSAPSSPSALFPGLFPAATPAPIEAIAQPVEEALVEEASWEPAVVDEAPVEPIGFTAIAERPVLVEEAIEGESTVESELYETSEEDPIAAAAFVPLTISHDAEPDTGTNSGSGEAAEAEAEVEDVGDTDGSSPELVPVGVDTEVREPVMVSRLLDPASVPLERSQADRDAALTITHPHPNVADLFRPASPAGAHAADQSPADEPIIEAPVSAPLPYAPEPLTVAPAPVLDVAAPVPAGPAPLSPADLLGLPQPSTAPPSEAAPSFEVPFAPLVAPAGEQIPQPSAPALHPEAAPIPAPSVAPLSFPLLAVAALPVAAGLAAAAAANAAPLPVIAEVDEPDLFEQRAVRTPQPIATHAPVQTVGHRGEVVFFGAGKGGVGKSTQTLLTAHTAAKAGLRVTVVDANRGQADIRTMLRLNKAPLPTIYDAVRTGNPADAFLRPDQYNQYRPHGLEALSFALVQGPPPSLADPSVVTAEVYAQVIEYARQHSDLVVVDTQIAEAYLSDIFEGVVIPNLLSGGWWVAIVNESRAGVDNLTERLIEFETRGVTNARNLIMASRYSDFDEATQRSIERKYAQFGTFIGSAADDPNIADQMNLGNIFIESRATVDTTRALLLRVTGNQAFNPVASHTGKRRGWFRR